MQSRLSVEVEVGRNRAITTVRVWATELEVGEWCVAESRC